jgi:hypothetical protein
MEDIVSCKEFILREVASVSFINEIITNKEWHVRINENITEIAINGVVSQQVSFNPLLRTLVWGNPEAATHEIQSGAVYESSSLGWQKLTE